MSCVQEGSCSADQLNQMFAEKFQHFKFQIPVSKIQRVWPAFNDSIVAFVVLNPSAIIHFDRNGRESYRYTVDKCGKALCLIDDRSIAVTEVSRNRITLINLQSKSLRHIEHQYAKDIEQNPDLAIHYFPDKNLLCLQQESKYQTILFTYYSLQSILKYVDQIQHQKFGFKSTNPIIISAKYVHDHKILIKIYDLKTRPREPQIIEIESYLIKFGCYSAIKFGPNLVLLINQFPYQTSNYKILIVDIKSKKLRATNFGLNSLEVRSIFAADNIGDFSLLFAKSRKPLENNQEPFNTIYFVCHRTEAVLREIQASQSIQLHPHRLPLNTFLMIQESQNTILHTDLVVRTFKVLTKKEQYLFIMLKINEDFDDDLLSDVIGLIAD